MIGYLYILQLSNGKYYIGSTRNLKERIERHTRGGVISTKKSLPFICVFNREYETYEEAYFIERQLKKSKSRKVIEEFILP